MNGIIGIGIFCIFASFIVGFLLGWVSGWMEYELEFFEDQDETL